MAGRVTQSGVEVVEEPTSANARVTQVGVEVLVVVTPTARISQVAVQGVQQPTDVRERVTQVAVQVVEVPTAPSVRLTQAAVQVVYVPLGVDRVAGILNLEGGGTVATDRAAGLLTLEKSSASRVAGRVTFEGLGERIAGIVRLEQSSTGRVASKLTVESGSTARTAGVLTLQLESVARLAGLLNLAAESARVAGKLTLEDTSVVERVAGIAKLQVTRAARVAALLTLTKAGSARAAGKLKLDKGGTARTAARVTFNAPPSAPTIDSGTPVNPNLYDRFTLLTLKATGTDPQGDAVRYEWWYSADAGVGWTLIGSSALVASGSQGTLLWDAAALASGAYRLRSRTIDYDGLASAYTTQSSDFTLDARPQVSLVLPADDQSLRADAAQEFSWLFSGPEGGEAQDGWWLRREHAVTHVVEWWRDSDSTWQPAETENSGAAASVTFPAGDWTAVAEDWMWSVKVRDDQALVSGYTPVRIARFYLAENPVITEPSGDVTTSSFLVEWTVADQSAYRVRVLGGAGFATLVFDSGKAYNPAARSLTVGPLVDGETYRFELITWSMADLQSDVQSVDQDVVYAGVAPNLPSLAAVAMRGPLRVQLTVTNPGGGTAVTSNEIWRATAGAAGPYSRIATGVAVNGTYTDHVVAPNTGYWYYARALAANGTFRDSA